MTTSVTEDSGASSKENAPLPESSRAPNREAEILAELKAHSEVVEMPRLWRLLTSTLEVLRLVCSPDELVQLLSKKFSVAELRASGVIKEKAGTIRLSSVFGDGGESMFIVPADAKTPREIYSSRGEIGGTGALRRKVIAETTPTDEKRYLVLLVGCERDYQLLSALGLYPLLVSPLAKFRGEIWSQIFRPYVDFRYTFVIVSWQIAARDPQPSAQTVKTLEQLWRVSNSFGFEIETRFSVWGASPDFTSRLIDAAQCADRKLIHDLIIEAATKRRRAPTDFYQDLHYAKDVELPIARAWLIETLASPKVPLISAGVKREANRYRRALEKLVVTPFFAAAAAGQDPVDRTLNLIGATLAQHLLEGDQLLMAADDVLHGRTPGVDWQLPPEKLTEAGWIMNSLLRMKRVLK